MRNLVVLTALILIGLLAHYLSLSLAVYGDDWQGIYFYLAQKSNAVHYGFLPGFLAILVPYGFSVFMMGILYHIFGLNSTPYYLISLMFRIFASYALFLTCKTIVNDKNNSLLSYSSIISLLASTLFLVGLSGIEVTDWLFNMNVYLAVGFYLLGIRSQIQFLLSGSNKDAVKSITLSTLAMITAPIRFQAMVILIPLIDIVFLKSKKARATLKQMTLKNFIFIFIVFSLLTAGLFGRSHDVFNRLRGEFLNTIISHPQESLSAFLQWNGAVILPDYIFGSKQIQTAGFIFLLLLLAVNILKIKEGKAKIQAVSIILLSFVGVMWFFFPLHMIGSNHRYLLVIFSAWCLLVGVMAAIVSRTHRFLRNVVIVLLLILIFLQYYSLRATYKHWMSNGRGQKFTQAVHGQIIGSIPLPLTKNDIIYLDFDDMAKDQSVVFGLGYKILVLSNTLDENYFPNIYDNNIKDSKSLIIKRLKDKESQGLSEEDLIERVFAFELREGIFKNTTYDFRKELSTLKQ